MFNFAINLGVLCLSRHCDIRKCTLRLWNAKYIQYEKQYLYGCR